MRLLDTTSLALVDVRDDAVPRYAILSHTWGLDEVTYQDLVRAPPPPPPARRHRHLRSAFDRYRRHRTGIEKKAGFAKVERAAAIALARGYSYIWIDTCCIDKSSSADLSEAINSMYRWYQQADECYAFLQDVRPSSDAKDGADTTLVAHVEFRSSRWFTRGWTLQELIAPKTVIFLASDWTVIGRKNTPDFLKHLISEITGIPEDVLDGRISPSQLSVSARMKWASHRLTTRVEDMAYCLMGLFEVNMPLLYGEGQRAYTRLQEEIIRSVDDQSLFAWNTFDDSQDPDALSGMLASSPAEFENAGDIQPLPPSPVYASVPSDMTNHGLRVQLYLTPADDDYGNSMEEDYYAILDCFVRVGDEHLCPTIVLRRLSQDQYARIKTNVNTFLPPLQSNYGPENEGSRATVFVRQQPVYYHLPQIRLSPIHAPTQLNKLRDSGLYTLSETHPPGQWNSATMTMRVEYSRMMRAVGIFRFQSATGPKEYIDVLVGLRRLDPMRWEGWCFQRRCDGLISTALGLVNSKIAELSLRDMDVSPGVICSTLGHDWQVTTDASVEGIQLQGRLYILVTLRQKPMADAIPVRAALNPEMVSVEERRRQDLALRQITSPCWSNFPKVLANEITPDTAETGLISGQGGLGALLTRHLEGIRERRRAMAETQNTASHPENRSIQQDDHVSLESQEVDEKHQEGTAGEEMTTKDAGGINVEKEEEASTAGYELTVTKNVGETNMEKEVGTGTTGEESVTKTVGENKMDKEDTWRNKDHSSTPTHIDPLDTNKPNEDNKNVARVETTSMLKEPAKEEDQDEQETLVKTEASQSSPTTSGEHGQNSDSRLDFLCLAVFEGNLAEIDRLMSTDIDPEKRTGPFGLTLLHWALAGGSVEAINKIEALKVDMLAKCDAGWSAVHIALFNEGAWQALCSLVESRVGSTSVYNHATLTTEPEFASSVMAAKTDTHLETALHLAAAYWPRTSTAMSLFGQMWQAVSAYTGNNPRNADDETPLHRAAQFNQDGIVYAIVMLTNRRPGFDIDLTDKYGRSPLWHAAASGSGRAVGTLLSLGANPNFADDLGRTPLHAACRGGLDSVAERLIQAGALRSVVTAVLDLTPLDMAAMFGHVGCVRKLVAVEISTSARGTLPTGEAKNRALHKAASCGWMAAVVALCKVGANPFVPMEEGYFKLDLSKTSCILVSASGDAKMAASSEGHADIAEYFEISEDCKQYRDPSAAVNAEHSLRPSAASTSPPKPTAVAAAGSSSLPAPPSVSRVSEGHSSKSTSSYHQQSSKTAIVGQTYPGLDHPGRAGAFGTPASDFQLYYPTPPMPSVQGPTYRTRTPYGPSDPRQAASEPPTFPNPSYYPLSSSTSWTVRVPPYRPANVPHTIPVQDYSTPQFRPGSVPGQSPMPWSTSQPHSLLFRPGSVPARPGGGVLATSTKPGIAPVVLPRPGSVPAQMFANRSLSDQAPGQTVDDPPPPRRVERPTSSSGWPLPVRSPAVAIGGGSGEQAGVVPMTTRTNLVRLLGRIATPAMLEEPDESNAYSYWRHYDGNALAEDDDLATTISVVSVDVFELPAEGIVPHDDPVTAQSDGPGRGRGGAKRDNQVAKTDVKDMQIVAAEKERTDDTEIGARVFTPGTWDLTEDLDI